MNSRLRALLSRRPGPSHSTVPAGMPAPGALEVGPRALRAGEVWCRTLIITGYPREVGNGWLEPLVTHPGAADVAVHVEPIPPAVAAARLRRQLARLESTRRLDADYERLDDAEVAAAADDAQELARRLLPVLFLQVVLPRLRRFTGVQIDLGVLDPAEQLVERRRARKRRPQCLRVG
jgi:hypothetical protein